jgi:hypothetical protein
MGQNSSVPSAGAQMYQQRMQTLSGGADGGGIWGDIKTQLKLAMGEVGSAGKDIAKQSLESGKQTAIAGIQAGQKTAIDSLNAAIAVPVIAGNVAQAGENVTQSWASGTGTDAAQKAMGDEAARQGVGLTATTGQVADNLVTTAGQVAGNTMQGAAVVEGACESCPIGGDDAQMGRICGGLTGDSALTVEGAYESFVLGGKEAVDLASSADSGLGVEDAVLQFYSGSPAARGKEGLVKKLSEAAGKILQVDTKGMKPDQVLAKFMDTLPDPRKEAGQFRKAADQQNALCRMVAKAINEAVGSRVIGDGAPEMICRQVFEVMYSLQKGLQAEFLIVYTNTSRQLANLRALIQALEELRAKAAESVQKQQDSEAKISAQNALAATDDVLGEAKRQLSMLSAAVVGVLGESGAEVDTIIGKRKKLFNLVEKITPLQPGSTNFSRVLAAALGGLADTALMATAVDRALKQVGLSVSDYVSTRSVSEMQSKLDALALKGDAVNVRLAGQTLLKYFGLRDDMAKDITGGDDANAPYENNPRVKSDLKRRKVVLDSLMRSFVSQFNGTFSVFTATIERIAIKIAGIGHVSSTEALTGFRQAIQGIKLIAYPDSIKALIGYLVGPSASAERNEFVDSLRAASTFSLALAENAEFSVVGADLRELSASLDKLVATVDSFKKEIQNNFGGAPFSGGDDSQEVAKYSYIPLTAVAQLEPKLKVALNSTAESLGAYVEKLDYYIELAFVRDNFRRQAAVVANDEEKCATVNAAAIGSKIQEIRNELKEALGHVFDTGAADDCAGKWVAEPGVPADVKSQRVEAQKATAKMLQSMYTAKVGLFRVVESFDAYMRAFTEAVLKDPTAVADLKRLFDPVKLARNWYTSSTGNLMASVFETFPSMTDSSPAAGLAPRYLNVLVAGGKLLTVRKYLNRPGANQVHYYQVIEDALAAPPRDARFPGNPYAVIPPANLPGAAMLSNWSDASKRASDAYDSTLLLKNIIGAFFYIGNKFGDKNLLNESLLPATQMYDSLMTYLEVSAFTVRNPATQVYNGTAGAPNGGDERAYGRWYNLDAAARALQADPGHDAGAALTNSIAESASLVTAGAQSTLQNAYQDGNVFAGVAAPLSGAVGGNAFEGSAVAGGAAFFAANMSNAVGTMAQTGVSMSSVWGGLGNIYAESDEYFFRVLRGMSAKVMAVMGVNTMLEKPFESLVVDPIRTVLGAAEGIPEVIPAALPLYMNGTLVLEFFKSLFALNQPEQGSAYHDVGARFAAIPDFEGEFADLLNLFFVQMRNVDASAATYTDGQIRSIVYEFNRVYSTYKSKGSDAVRDAVFALISEINRRIALLTTADLMSIDKSIRDRQDTADFERDEELTDFELLPNENEMTVSKMLPSDRYAQLSATTPDAAAQQRYLLRKNDVKLINHIRHQVDNIVSETSVKKSGAKQDDFAVFLRDAEVDLREQPDNDKRFSRVASILRTRGFQFTGTSSRTTYAFHETVVTGINALNTLMSRIEQFVSQCGEHDALGFDTALDALLDSPGAAAGHGGGIFGGDAAGQPALGGNPYNCYGADQILATINRARVANGEKKVGLNALRFAAHSADISAAPAAATAGSQRNAAWLDTSALAINYGVNGADVSANPAYPIPGAGNAVTFAAAFGAGDHGPTLLRQANQPDLTVSAEGSVQAGGNNGMYSVLNSSSKASRKKGQRHYVPYETLKFALLNREGLLASLIETVSTFAGDSDGLVEASVSSDELYVDPSKLKVLVRDLIESTRVLLDKFRGLVPDLANKYTGSEDKAGTLRYLEKRFETIFVAEEIAVGDSQSGMQKALKIVGDNFRHAVKKFGFNIECSTAMLVQGQRNLVGGPGGGDLIAAVAAIDAGNLAGAQPPAVQAPSAYPYRCILPTIGFYSAMGLRFSPNETDGLGAGMSIIQGEPDGIWKLLGSVRNIAGSVSARTFKSGVLGRARLIDEGLPMKDSLFLGLNQLVLDLLNSGYDNTSEKLPKSLVLPFVEKLSAIIGEEKNSFPDMFRPGVVNPAGGVAETTPGQVFSWPQLHGQAEVSLNAPGGAWPASFVANAANDMANASIRPPHASFVMLSSVSTLVRNAYYNVDSNGRRINLWETTEELPGHIKERLRAFLPKIACDLELIRKKAKFLREIAQSKMEVTGADGLAGAAAATVSFYDATPFTSNDAVGAAAEGAGFGPSGKTGFQTAYFVELFRNIEVVAGIAQDAAKATLASVGRPPLYFEEFEGSMLAVAQAEGRRPHASPSAALLLTANLPGSGDGCKFLSNINGVGSPDFKLRYGTSFIFAPDGIEVSRFEGGKMALDMANAILPSPARVPDSIRDNFLRDVARAVRFGAEATNSKQFLNSRDAQILGPAAASGLDAGFSPGIRRLVFNANGAARGPVTTDLGGELARARAASIAPVEGNAPPVLPRADGSSALLAVGYSAYLGLSRMLPYIYVGDRAGGADNKPVLEHALCFVAKGDAGELPLAVYEAQNNEGPAYPYVTSAEIERTLEIALSTGPRALQTIVKFMMGGTESERKRSDLWIRAFLTLRIVPIQPNVLAKAIPFATLYSWDYAFGQLASQMLGKYDAASIKKCNEYGAANGNLEHIPLDSPTIALLSLLMHPNRASVSRADFEDVIARVFVGDDSLPISRPKLLSDAVYNNALLRNTWAREFWPDEYALGASAFKNTAGQNLGVITSPNTLLTRKGLATFVSLVEPLAADFVRGGSGFEGTFEEKLAFGLLKQTVAGAASETDSDVAANVRTAGSFHIPDQTFNSALLDKIETALVRKLRAFLQTGELRLAATNPARTAPVPAQENFAGLVARGDDAIIVDEVSDLGLLSIAVGLSATVDVLAAANLDRVPASSIGRARLQLAVGLILSDGNGVLGSDNLDQAPLNTWYRFADNGTEPVVAAAPGTSMLQDGNEDSAVADAFNDSLKTASGTGGLSNLSLTVNPIGVSSFNSVAAGAAWNIDLSIIPGAVGNMGPSDVSDRTKQIAARTISWSERFYALNTADGAAGRGPLILRSGGPRTIIGSTLDMKAAAVSTLVIYPVGFGVIAPLLLRTQTGLDTTAAVSAGDRQLFYPNKNDLKRIQKPDLSGVPLGDTSASIATASYARFTTTFARKQLFLANLQRIMLHKIQMDVDSLGKSKLLRGLTVAEPRTTDFRTNEGLFDYTVPNRDEN